MNIQPEKISKLQELVRRERCPVHPEVLRLDEATTSGIVPGSLCPICDDIIQVDVVRRLFARSEP